MNEFGKGGTSWNHVTSDCTAYYSPHLEILNEFRISFRLGAELLICLLNVGQECLIGEDGIPDDILR